MIVCHALFLPVGALLIAWALICRRASARLFRQPRLVRQVFSAAGLLIVLAGVIGMIDGLVRPHSLFGVGLLVAEVLVAAVACAIAFESRIRTSAAGRPRRILAIGAHPDDLELACGGTLAKLADAGHEIHGLVMSRGAQGGDEAVRIEEARRGARFMGLVNMDVRDFPDTALDRSTNAMREAIESVINEVQPHIIFTHSGHDQHQDHHAVHLATLRAARQHHSILCFESPSTTREFNPSFFVEIDDYVETKVHAVLTHRNQSEIGRAHV